MVPRSTSAPWSSAWAECFGFSRISATTRTGALFKSLGERVVIDCSISMDGALDLLSAAYRALCEVVELYLSELMPEFTPNPDPRSPTHPSSG